MILKKLISKKLLKRSGLGFLSLGAVVAGIGMFSAFESHIVNVTARIENALAVSEAPIAFGTVFPQEYLVRDLQVGLSDSFIAEGRVDDVSYVIKQKPKVKLFVADTVDPNANPQPGDPYSTITNVEGFTGPAWQYCESHLPPDADLTTPFYNVDFTDVYWQYCYLPLANSLSKHKADDETGAAEGDTEVDAFHQAYLWNTSISSLNPTFLAGGKLTKSAGDIEDSWIIDLKVPCFWHHCAQEAFDPANTVDDAIPGFYVPAEFQLDPLTEHLVFGTDLWIEVNGISLPPAAPPPPAPNPPPPPPTTGTLTVTKVVTNDNGGNAVVGDFALFVDGNPVTSGVPVVLPAGAHTVSETGLSGYDDLFSGACNTIGQVTLNPGDNLSCTITNDDLAASITLTKVVVNDDAGNAGPNDFLPSVGGTAVSSGSSTPVNSNTPIAINETQLSGYVFVGISGDGLCPAVLGGTVTLNEGQSISCIITNDDEELAPPPPAP